jgi:hypothetical protein
VADKGDIRCLIGQTPLDVAVGELARRQYGVVALTQLKGLGLSKRAVGSRLAAGRLHRIHHGVYAVGHPVLKTEGHLLAAVLACGPDAVLSHRSAAGLWGLRPNNRTRIELTTPTRAGRTRAGLQVHAGALHPDDRATVDRIATTSIPRTLLDLAEVIDRRGLERACDRADQLRLLDMRALGATLSRANGRRGAAKLGAIFTGYAVGESRTRTELEHILLGLCADAGLETPLVNSIVEGIEVDFAWPGRRLVAETDGRETHATRRAFEEDRRRDQLLMLAGWRVVRFTWRQVVETPTDVERTLASLLA